MTLFFVAELFFVAQTRVVGRGRLRLFDPRAPSDIRTVRQRLHES